MTQRDNMKFGINRYIGIWESTDGYQLDITKKSNTSAVVSFYKLSCEPIKRPYFNERSTIMMPASYDDYLDEFRVDLWEKGKGFELHIKYDQKYELDKFGREALIPAFSRYEKDIFLENYYGLFGTLKHFVRIENKINNIVTGQFTAPN